MTLKMYALEQTKRNLDVKKTSGAQSASANALIGVSVNGLTGISASGLTVISASGLHDVSASGLMWI